MTKYVTEEHLDSRLGELEGRIIAKMDSMMTIMDGMSTILQRLDQERVFTVEWIRRVESDVNRIKAHLKLA